jgi:hypothetical protein
MQRVEVGQRVQDGLPCLWVGGNMIMQLAIRAAGHGDGHRIVAQKRLFRHRHPQPLVEGRRRQGQTATLAAAPHAQPRGIYLRA